MTLRKKLFAVLGGIFSCVGFAKAEPVINEFVFNHVGSDTYEYVELLGPPNTDYSNLTLLEIEGDAPGNGLIEAVIVVQATGAIGHWATAFLSNEFENGSNTLLLVRGFSGALGDDLDINDDGVLDSTPWDAIVDSIAVSDGGAGDHTYSNVVLNPDFDGGSFTVSGASRIPDGRDTDTINDWVRNDFHGEGLPGFIGTPQAGEALNTPAAPNALPVIEPTPQTVAIYEIQGAGHVSAFVGEKVQTSGVVTATRRSSFYLQDIQGDGNSATSDAIVVFAGSNHGIAVGDEISLIGTVSEYYPGGINSGNLSTTQLLDPEITLLSQNHALPEPMIVGRGGRVPPNMIIDDDAVGDVNNTGSFDPDSDGIDFYESMESMLLQINNATVVGSNRFGEITVLADNGLDASGINSRGGITVSADDFNPERIIIDDAIVSREPRTHVGDKFLEPIVGVLDYSFGNFKLFNISTLPPRMSATLTREITHLSPGPVQLTVASFNVENLDAGDRSSKYSGLADQIVNHLLAPDLIALQEIQDNSGSTDDGVVAATQTYTALIDAIVAEGGPLYQYTEISPQDKQDGGQPGANIRVGFLYQPERVQLINRPGGDALSPTVVEVVDQAVQLSLSPGRIDPGNPAFVESRKPLAAEFVFLGKKLFVIANHFSSKGGDDPLFGRIQPPLTPSENYRIQQAGVVNEFVKQILEKDDDANIIVLGDMNDFSFSRSLKALAGKELINLLEDLPGTEQYTFNFEGNSQALDHILVSEELAEDSNAEVDIVHVNADYHNRSQSSDHDPVLARFCMDDEEPELSVNLTSEQLNGEQIVKAQVNITDQDPNVRLSLVEVEVEGNKDAVRIIDDTTFALSKGAKELELKYSAEDSCGNSETEEVKIRLRQKASKH